MGKVKVVNHVDMLSFAINSEEEIAEKVGADSHSDSSSEDEMVKLEVRPTRQFPRHRTEPQEPTQISNYFYWYKSMESIRNEIN